MISRAWLWHCFNAFLKNLKFNRLGLIAVRWELLDSRRC